MVINWEGQQIDIASKEITYSVKVDMKHYTQTTKVDHYLLITQAGERYETKKAIYEALPVPETVKDNTLGFIAKYGIGAVVSSRIQH